MSPRIRLSSSLLYTIQKQHTQFVPALPFISSRCASILSSLADNPGAYNKKIRRGRGPASGKGKTSGRGQKGQRAHGKVPRGFEGGQTPLRITNPPRGREKYNPFKVEMSPINLDRIQSWIDQGRLDPKHPITMRELAKSRCLHGIKTHGVKVLARNAEELTSCIDIVVSRASKEAIARIESLGGSVITRFYSPTSIKRVRRGDSHPFISLQAPSTLLALAAKDHSMASSSILSSLKVPSSGEDSLPKERTRAVALDKGVMATIMQSVGEKYKYRLPDATSRKDIEYYRDPVHRGYLTHTVKKGETPSLYWKLPKIRASTGQSGKKSAAKEREDNKIF